MQTKHRCEACKAHFESPRTRDRFCADCRQRIAREKGELEALLLMSFETSANQQVQKEITEEFRNALACPTCGWDKNINRIMPKDMRRLLVDLDQLAIAKIKHGMHHVFWERFPLSRRLAPKELCKHMRFYELLQANWKEFSTWFAIAIGKLAALVMHIEMPPAPARERWPRCWKDLFERFPSESESFFGRWMGWSLNRIRIPVATRPAAAVPEQKGSKQRDSRAAAKAPSAKAA